MHQIEKKFTALQNPNYRPNLVCVQLSVMHSYFCFIIWFVKCLIQINNKLICFIVSGVSELHGKVLQGQRREIVIDGYKCMKEYEDRTDVSIPLVRAWEQTSWDSKKL